MSPSPEQRRRFLVLGTREVRLAENGIICRVNLRHDEDAFWGEARDVDTELGRARAAGRATLNAAEPVVTGVQLALEGALVLAIFGRRHVIVGVEAVSERRFAHLTGIAPIELSVEDAACLATLDAIDRWLGG